MAEENAAPTSGLGLADAIAVLRNELLQARAALLPTVERELGAEHPQTLAALGGLAYWTGAAGDAAAARDQFAALLPVVERVLGAERATTLAARGNLACCTQQADTSAGI